MAESGDIKNPVFVLKSFMAGGIAGMTSKTAVAPLERVKILLQVHNNHYKQYGVLTALRAVVVKERFLDLYKGNGAQMVRIFPYAAIQYLAFEVYKNSLMKLTNESKSAINHELRFVAGSLAGVTSVLITYPLDLVRARLAFNVTIPHSSETIKLPTSISGTLIHVFRHEGGTIGLYRGISPALIAMVPYAGFNFYLFERSKYFLLQYFPTICGYRNKDNNLILNVPTKVICGGLSGTISQTFIYPLDVTRRRMQLSFTSDETKKFADGIIKTLTITYRDYGIVKGLYRGMSINYLRVFPMVGVSFCTYEVMKQLLGLDTSI